MFSPMEERMSTADLFSSLMAIDFMCTELCNLKCDFCPRSKDYPNLNLHMSLDIIQKVAEELADLGYKNRLLFCGFGEPLLYKHLVEAVTILKNQMPWQQNIHIVTNGDRLNKEKVKELYKAGVNKIFVSMYQGPEQVHRFKKIFEDVDPSMYLLQHYYKPEEENYGFEKLSNRAGYNFEDKSVNTTCNLPFYAMNIHHDGDVLLCCQDWTKRTRFGNVMKTSIKDIWINNMALQRFRAKLRENRSMSPCKNCNIDGTLYGDKSKEILRAA